MKALVTGVSGFAGSHLVDQLLARGIEVFGTVHRTREGIDRAVRQLPCDLLDQEEVRGVVHRVGPDQVYHLAAHSFAADRDPWRTLEGNVRGQLNLLEALRDSSARILVVGSALEYGPVRPEELPLTEDHALCPTSAYALSKVAQDLMGYQYHRSHGLFIVRVRPFNHTGPRRGERFMESDFARQIARAEAGLGPAVLSVGNLENRRDFTDVRDVVEAYRQLLERGKPGEVYNVCSGRSWRIADVVETLVSKSRVAIRVEVDPERLRPDDVPVVEGSFERLGRLTGWAPRIPFQQSIEELLDYWRQRIRQELAPGGLPR
ncbi:MAG: GDP-mannose 4,6-dehydratase [Armatimonadetes bacterium]|nr:GDP-mannose 4,6-dehydratase [Armatimonadota bacterium]